MKRLRDSTDTPDTAVDDKQQYQPKTKRLISVDATFPETAAIQCSLPPHGGTIYFASSHHFESHYYNTHTNRCLECHKNLPSHHLLSLHIEECHDPLMVIRRKKGQCTYSCFLPECKQKFLAAQKRRMHMVDEHAYPPNFFFAVTKEGIDKRNTLLVDGSRRKCRPFQISGQVDETPLTGSHCAGSYQEEKLQDSATMSALTGGMAALELVPSSVRFGRGRPGFSSK